MARQEFLERLADNHEIQIKKTLEDLEARIVAEIDRKKVLEQAGKLIKDEFTGISTKIAIELRTDLKQYIDETYRTTADTLVRDYDQIVNEFMEEFGGLDIPDNFKSLTKVDLLTINQLKFQQFAGFEDLANRYLNEISSQVYQNAIAGKPFNEMVKDLRGLITGEVDRRGRPMSTYASQIAHDSVMQFDGQFTVYKSKEAGLDKFKYTGTLVTDSRPHCVTHLNKVYTEEQIRSIWQGSWAGKSEGDPFTVRGGYRCRHTWLPVADEFFDEDEPDLEEDVTKEDSEQRGVNKSSLKNKIKEKDINVLPNTVVGNELQKQISKNAKDKRYPYDNVRDRPVSRFDTENIGQIIGIEKLDDKTATQLLVIMQELDDLAILYDVPKLRSININGRMGAIMSMGDGNLKINYKMFNKNNPAEEIQIMRGTGFYENEVELAKNFKLGDAVSKERKTKPSTWVRPFNAFYYEDNEFDRMRSILYHEFAHTVHQLKKVKFEKETFGYSFSVPVEEALKKLRVKGKGASRYSDKNTKEWFAENFSLYHMGKLDLVDKRFIDFLESEVMK